MGKTIIILCSSYRHAKYKWDLWRKNKIMFTKAQYNNLMLWDVFGNTWQFVYNNRELRGCRAQIYIDDFPFNPKEIEEILK